ncbi:phosphatase PAP2 family protein [[Clostridium] aminophilum]|uniref:phosphatase PAP2 family protein n=1 Tax=[Clostridium] aminophilum TaxID=1526 RepID=UPI003FCC4BFF
MRQQKIWHLSSDGLERQPHRQRPFEGECLRIPSLDPRIIPDSDALAAATGYSFPSGHSMNAAALFGRGAIRRELPRFLRAVPGLIAVLIALSRNFLGVHTPQDIL